MENNYKDKYRKYKKKYLELKGRINNNFYIVHRTKDSSNVDAILDSGILLPGEKVPYERRYLWKAASEEEDCPQKFIYGNIYFKDLKNIKINDNSLVFNSKILEDYDIGYIFVDALYQVEVFYA